MGLSENEGKTKYMLSLSGVRSRMGSQITANSYNFDVVKEFIHLVTAINTNNYVRLERPKLAIDLQTFADFGNRIIFAIFQFKGK